MFYQQKFSSRKYEESIVAQRIVFDGIQHDGGYLKVNISQDMLCYICNSHKAYENVREENRKRQTETQKQKLRRKCCQLN